ncbi:MAG: AgmX/PglI C-terminal domain-containing protein [Myxococcales bacterium]|nr:AgmX/PglI C-terminal domain-containing protein [Myxococcales bacterium]
MATAPAPGKNLRIALIQGSKITEDRTFKRRVPVTVGQDAKNTLVVPVSNLPSSFTLFELVNNQYALVFKAGMEGKVTVNGAELTLQQAREKGLAKSRGDALVLPLTDASKGRVALGEVSVLFQFVTPPPEPKREELPLTIKGNFLSQIDHFFFLCLAASVFVHFSGATFIACQPIPEEKELSLDELPDRFVKAMMPVEVKKPEPKPEVAKGDEKKEEKKEEKVAEGEKKEKAATSNEKKAELQARVAKSGLLKIIGAAGSGEGAFADVLGSSNGVGDVASALSGAGGVNMATADALAAGGPKGSGTGSAADIGSLGTAGAGKVDLAEKGPAAIRGKVADAAPEVESADIDRNKLNAFLRGRIRAIQGCYEKELKRNPNLKGKVVVRFSITTGGRAAEIEIEQDTLGNDAVGSCIKTVIRGWVFPFKPDSDVSVAYPFVFSPAS